LLTEALAVTKQSPLEAMMTKKRIDVSAIEAARLTLHPALRPNLPPERVSAPFAAFSGLLSG
jgi:hypothetical protein